MRTKLSIIGLCLFSLALIFACADLGSGANGFRIYYQGNGNTGGAVPQDSDSHAAGQSAILKTNSGNLVKTGYSLLGWTTMPDLSGTHYLLNGGITMPAQDLTLYALWMPDNLKVSVHWDTTGIVLLGYVTKPSGMFSIPQGITEINDSAFEYCTGLTSVLLPDSLTKIGNATFRGCTGLQGINLSKVSTLGSEVFANCSSLQNVTLSASLTTAPIQLFYNCSDLLIINLPQGLTSIGQFAFSGTGLYSITIPASVTRIDSAAFSACPSLVSFTLLPTTPPTTDSTIFNGCNSNLAITIPAGTTAAYSAATGWGYYASRFGGSATPIYRVYYNANQATGGSTPSDSANYAANATATVLGNTGNLVRTGYTFAGWRTSASGSGTLYLAGNSYTMGSADVTFYAQWTATTPPPAHTYADASTAIQALGNGQVAALSTTNTSATAYNTSATGVTTMHLVNYVNSGYTLNGTVTQTTSLPQTLSGTVNFTGGVVTRIQYDTIVPATPSGKYIITFSDTTVWTYNFSGGSFTQN